MFKELNETKDSLNISSLVTQASVLLSMLNRKFVEKQLDNCLEEVIECASRIGKDNWVDSAHALCIIGESAKVNMKALNVLLLISNLSLASFHQDLNRTISNSSKTETQENGGGSEQGGEVAYGSFGVGGRRGVESWQWELACTYADVLAEVCVNGTQSVIKKKALLGFHKDSRDALQNKYKRVRLKGYGLLDLTQIQTRQKKEGKLVNKLIKVPLIS